MFLQIQGLFIPITAIKNIRAYKREGGNIDVEIYYVAEISQRELLTLSSEEYEKLRSILIKNSLQ